MKRRQLDLSQIKFGNDVAFPTDNLYFYQRGKRIQKREDKLRRTNIVYTNDIIESNFFIRGVVIAHFMYPTAPSFSPGTHDMVPPEIIGGITDEQAANIDAASNQRERFSFSWLMPSDVNDFKQFDPIFSGPSELDFRIQPPAISGLWGGIEYGAIQREWEYTNKYADYPFSFPSSGESNDILFIKDTYPNSDTCIAVVGTQHYGTGFIDRKTPINVDSAYIPSRFHISVGDVIEIYSGHIIENLIYRPGDSSDPKTSRETATPILKHFIRLNENPLYTVRAGQNYEPEFSYTKSKTFISNDKDYDLNSQDIFYSKKPISLKDNLPTPKPISIPRLISIGRPIVEEGMLVKIRNCVFDPEIFSKSNSDFIYLEPNRLYQIIQDGFPQHKISMRICNGTEMAIHMPKISILQPFDLVGIVAGQTAEQQYEIWPRTMFDIGIKPQPEYSGDALVKSINSAKPNDV